MSIGWLDAVLLGLVQGLTEFLPVSSSAHLRIAGAILPSAQDPGAAFSAITQIGTELAVLVYFRKDLGRVCSAWMRQNIFRSGDYVRDDARMGWMIILGSIPIVVLGLLFKDVIRTEARNLHIDTDVAASFVPLMHFNLLPSVLLVTQTMVDMIANNIANINTINAGRANWLWVQAIFKHHFFVPKVVLEEVIRTDDCECNARFSYGILDRNLAGKVRDVS